MPNPLRKVDTHIAFLIGISVVALLAVTHTGTSVCNDASRLATAESLVNRGTFVINESYFAYTCDYLQLDGKMYSDKPPVFSVLLAGVYAAVTGITGWQAETDLFGLYYLLSLLTSGVAFVALVLGVRRIALQLGSSAFWAAMVASASCFGTLAFTYASLISTHLIAASLLVWAASRLLQKDEAAPGWTGLLFGLATVIDPLAICFAAPLGLLALRRDWRFGVLMVLAALGPVVMHGALTYVLVGNPLALNLDPQHFRYEGSIHNKDTLTGFGWKHASLGATAKYAFDCLFGHRGFVPYNLPAFFGVGGLCYLAFSRACEWSRAVLAGLLIFFVLTIGFSLNYSGSGYGIRWHALAAPLAASGLSATFSAEICERLRKAAIVASLCVGAVVASAGTVNPMSLWTGKTHSIVKVLDSPEENVAYLLQQARPLHDHARHAQAIYFAELAARYVEPVPDIWYILVHSAIAIDDQSRLRRYRNRLETLDMPYADQLIGNIDDYLSAH